MTTRKIHIRPAEGYWVVRAGGAVIGESHSVLELIEGDAPPVIYFPRDDVGMAFLDASDTSYHCPLKGDACYFSIQTKSELLKDAVWSYQTPLNGAERIAGHLAFDPEKVTVERL